jgi:pyridoxine kinase
VARVLCISSHVGCGHIGLSATVPALEALGHEVIALPTVVLSNHPGHAAFSKCDVRPEFLERSAAVFQTSGRLADIDAIVSGYMPSADHVAAVAHIVHMVRNANSKALFVCDPVLGDDPGGLYIPLTAANAIRDQLIGLADWITPNRFELAWLSGAGVTSAETAEKAAEILDRPITVVTSVPTGSATTIGTMLVERNPAPHLFKTKKWAKIPHGTGDLLTGLFVGHLLSKRTPTEALRRANACVAAIAELSQGRDELDLTGSREGWLDSKLDLTHMG